MSWKSAAKKQFDAWSKGYDHSILQWIFFGPSHKKMLEDLTIPHGARVLDVGCGTGLFALRILRQFPSARVVGLDLSEGMLRRASVNCAKYPDRLQFVRGDSEKLPFADDSFDLITCVHSFHHYPFQGRAVSQMHRVLKPDGQLIIVDADRDFLWGHLLYDWVVSFLEGGVHHCSARQFQGLLHSAGFEQVRQHYKGLLAPFLINRAIAAKRRDSSKTTVDSQAA